MSHNNSDTALSVNLNKIALIRNSRPGNYPNVVAHGEICIAAGADGLTVHPRPDQRHIRPHDVYELSELVKSHTNIEFNIEGNPYAESIGSFPGFIKLVQDVRPHQCTLVPDSNDQLTSDHGFDLKIASKKLRPLIHELQDLGVRVSLFMDPIIEQISLAKELGADRIELYTGPYAEAYKNNDANFQSLFGTYFAAATHAQSIGIGLNAGHDLNLDNLAHFRQVPALLEVSIGHALTVDAIAMGMPNAVAAYKKLCTA
ncbi:pyridoxine 5'-phosphate synthase [Cellvibrio sp. NN19]|uniref:pyridoxine 5'-phosphate synthase n=1 Tax=Cellvibrio chitinivorans TaxID=3102792 RepID=UPI002B40B837|nr:pyridoxine 5'-phosphate synthase [Cellvibrio sp. NN19]